MISQQRSGPPSTQNVQTGADGVCLRFATWTSCLQVRVDSPVRLYWTKRDFEADKNGLDLSGDDEDRLLSLPAAVPNLWVRGLGGDTRVSVTAIGIG